eukprot:1157834-Pelagomonas_calceolata.AAC.20
MPAAMRGNQLVQERSGKFLPAVEAPDPSWTREVVHMAMTWCARQQVAVSCKGAVLGDASK